MFIGKEKYMQNCKIYLVFRANSNPLFCRNRDKEWDILQDVKWTCCWAMNELWHSMYCNDIIVCRLSENKRRTATWNTHIIVFHMVGLYMVAQIDTILVFFAFLTVTTITTNVNILLAHHYTWCHQWINRIKN